jgi:hypothetical protein
MEGRRVRLELDFIPVEEALPQHSWPVAVLHEFLGYRTGSLPAEACFVEGKWYIGRHEHDGEVVRVSHWCEIPDEIEGKIDA